MSEVMKELVPYPNKVSDAINRFIEKESVQELSFKSRVPYGVIYLYAKGRSSGLVYGRMLAKTLGLELEDWFRKGSIVSPSLQPRGKAKPKAKPEAKAKPKTKATPKVKAKAKTPAEKTSAPSEPHADQE